MKNNFNALILFFLGLSITYGQESQTYTLEYDIEAIAETEALKEQMMGQFGGFKKTFYKSGDFEMHELIIDNLTEVRFVKEGNEVWVYLKEEDKKYKFKNTKAQDENMKSQLNRVSPTWKKESIKEVNGLTCQNYVMDFETNNLEYCLSKELKTKVPISTIVNLQELEMVPLIMEATMPQRKGSTSKAKLKISVVNKIDTLDESVKSFGQEEYEEKTYMDAEKELMFGYMFAYLF